MVYKMSKKKFNFNEGYGVIVRTDNNEESVMFVNGLKAPYDSRFALIYNDTRDSVNIIYIGTGMRICERIHAYKHTWGFMVDVDEVKKEIEIASQKIKADERVVEQGKARYEKLLSQKRFYR